MTYYEFVKCLDDNVEKPITNEFILNLENAKISLVGNRYYRLIIQIRNYCIRKINNFSSEFFNKLKNVPFNSNNLSIELSNFKKNINYLFKLANLQYIKTDEQDDIKQTLNSQVKEFIEKLRKLYNDDEEINYLLNSFNLKEE